MPNKRSPRKLEEQKARKFIYQNLEVSKGIDKPREVVFKKTESELKEAVVSELIPVLCGEITREEALANIPDYPQGLVVMDNRGTGFFDVNLEVIEDFEEE